jgi:hypothetical protein
MAERSKFVNAAAVPNDRARRQAVIFLTFAASGNVRGWRSDRARPTRRTNHTKPRRQRIASKAVAQAASLGKRRGVRPQGERWCHSRRARKLTGKSGLNPSSFLISTSQKVGLRLSFERFHDDQTAKDRSHPRAGEAAASAGCAKGGASAIIRCRRDHVQTNADRRCPPATLYRYMPAARTANAPGL